MSRTKGPSTALCRANQQRGRKINNDQDPPPAPGPAEPQNPDQHPSADTTTFSPRRSRRKVVLVVLACVAVVISAGTIVQVRAASARSTRRLQASQAAA